MNVEFGEGVVEGLAKIGIDAEKEVRRGIINAKTNGLRLDAGIARIENQQWLCVLDKETGMLVDPMIGLEKFAELIVRECIAIADDLVDRTADGTWTSNELYTDYNGALFEVKRRIKEHFGVEE